MRKSGNDQQQASIALIGGSGLYELAGLEGVVEVAVETPFGAPSDSLLVGTLEGISAAFLARHGRGHRLLPSEVNHRANIFALKKLGVERVLSASAVGSMREEIRPRDVVLVDQFIDRSMHRQATFFGNGVAAHIAFADPVCPVLRSTALAAARAAEAGVHDGGTYLCIEGPAFSTRAESELYRAWGVDVIGMTNIQEAKLAREAAEPPGQQPAGGLDRARVGAPTASRPQGLRLFRSSASRDHHRPQRDFGRGPRAVEAVDRKVP
jgi:5'-methylthioadenosine phosphorylase